MANEKYIHAENFEQNKYIVPLSTLAAFAPLFKIKSNDRDTLVEKIKTILGPMLWDTKQSIFIEPQTNTRYSLDDLGFVYHDGLNQEDETKLMKYPAATCTLDNGLEFWIKRGPKQTTYLITNYLSNSSHESPAMKDELERIRKLQGIGSFTIRQILDDKKIDIKAGRPNPRTVDLEQA